MKKDDSLANMPRGTSYEINARSPITFRTLEQELATISVIAACMTTRVPGTPNQMSSADINFDNTNNKIHHDLNT